MSNQKNNAYEQQRLLSPSFIADLKTGALCGLTDMVKRRKDLLMCFRNGYINIYFMGHSLFLIEELGRGAYEITFDFNHARYTQDWENKLEVLKGLGFKLNRGKALKLPFKGIDKKDGKLKTHSGTNKISLTIFDPHKDFWKTSTPILLGFIGDYFSKNTQTDYFKEAAGLQPSHKKQLLEKERQQEIMAANQGLAGEYFIYDMEYTQPRNNGNEDTSGRFDMLAIHKHPDGKFNLVLMELKCTASACTANGSGVKDHLNDFNKYKRDISLVEIRKQEAIKVCNYYKDIFGKPEFIPTTLEGTEVLFIFTDKAEDFFRKDALLKREQKVFLPKGQYVLSRAVPE